MIRPVFQLQSRNKTNSWIINDTFINGLVTTRWIQCGDCAWKIKRDQVGACVPLRSQNMSGGTEEIHENIHSGQPVSGPSFNVQRQGNCVTVRFCFLCHKIESRNKLFGCHTGSVRNTKRQHRSCTAYGPETKTKTLNQPTNQLTI